MLGDGTRTHATVVAIYTPRARVRRRPARPRARRRPPDHPAARDDPRRGPATRPPSPGACARWPARYPGLRVSDRASLATATDADRETNRWLGPLFVAIIFAFTSIAVVNTLAMIALQRGRELGLLRLVGGTPRQVRSMARWEAGADHRDRAGPRPGDRGHGAAAAQPRADGQPPPVRAARPARRRSSASRRCWRCWPWRCRRGGRCARGRSRRSGWGSSRTHRRSSGAQAAWNSHVPRTAGSPGTQRNVQRTFAVRSAPFGS